MIDAELFLPGDRVLAAVSGGADSLALLHALAGLRARLRIELVAAHVHHGMRGADADADTAFLTDLCAAWGVPLEVVRRDVPALAAERRISVEEAGRAARYDAFRELAARHGCGKIATAHQADDQAETVLLNLFRGTGIDGLAGIPRRRPLHPGPGAPEVVRPLLRVPRAEIEAYCARHRLQPREDATNRDLRYRRSRIRHELLPLLERYDPAIRRHLLRLSVQAQEERDLLEPEAEALLAAAAIPGAARPPFPWVRRAAAGLDLDLRRLQSAPPALARRALRRAVRRLAPGSVEVDAGLVARLTDLAAGGRPGFVLPGGWLRARREGGILRLEPVPVPTEEPPAPVPVCCPGSTGARGFGIRIAVSPAGPEEDPRVPPYRAVVDAAALRPPLQLRAARTGDRMRPLGAPGSRLLSDLLGERKIPRDCRPHWPVLEDSAGIVWVLGLAVAERVRVGPRSADRLRIEFRADADGSGASGERMV